MREGRGPWPCAALITVTAALVAAAGMAVLPSASTAATATIVLGGGPPGYIGEAVSLMAPPAFPEDFSGVVSAVTLPSGEDASCPVPSGPGVAQCMAVSTTNTTTGYDPAQLQAAYSLGGSSGPSSLGGLTSAGTAESVAIVAAYDDPYAASDLAAYRAQYGLPACDTATDAGCLTKVNEDNQLSPLPAAPTAVEGDWTWEESADIDMVTAICPNCRILLFEASSDSIGNLGQADVAARNDGDFVDNGWGSPEFDGEAGDDGFYFNHPGTAEVFAAGNGGYGTTWPASSQFVTSVGGTTLTADSSAARGYTETAWADEASGCATAEPKPAWQTADDTSPDGCLNRTQNDVAADADPATGVAVYDSTPYTGTSTSRAADWGVAGGTSVAAAIITATYALNGYPEAGTYPSSYPYQAGNAADFYPVASGSNGTCETARAYLCNGEPTFNGPAGMGTPDGDAGLASSVTDLISVVNPGNQDYEVNTNTVSLGMSASDSATNQALTWSAKGLPSGLTINLSSGTITGAVGASASTSEVTVTATDTMGASGSVSFDIYVTSSTAAAYHQELGAVHLNTNSDCLDDTGGVHTNGNKVQVYTCNGESASQSWGWTPDGGPDGAGIMTLAPNCSGNSLCAIDCLSVTGNGTTVGTKVDLWVCDGASGQQWRIESDGQLLNPASGLCLTAPNTTNGTQIEIGNCIDAATQQWTPTPSPVQSGVTSMCLDDWGGNTTAGNKIQIYACNGDQSSQDWNFKPGDTVQIQGTSNCLTVTGASTLDGALIQLEPCNGSTSQKWVIGVLGELVNLNSGKCLDDPNNTTTNGTQLVQEDCYQLPGEVWVAT